MFSALPFALLLLTTLSGGSALPNAVGSPEEKTTSGIISATNDEQEPIALTKYTQARFLFGTSTKTRFVTTTTSTIITCVSKISTSNTGVITKCGKRKRRAIKLKDAASEGLLDSSLLELEDEGVASGRLLFSPATTFTTLTFTQVIDNTGAATVSIFLQCIPDGKYSVCYSV